MDKNILKRYNNIVRIVSQPKRIPFRVACRYLRRYDYVFMSSARGDGWKLYRYYRKKKGSVGTEGWKYAFVACIDNIPDGIISGNYWQNSEWITLDAKTGEYARAN